MKHFVLVGGGTGGHFYPLIAVAEALTTKMPNNEYKLFYLGPEPYNATALKKQQITYVCIPAGKQRRYFSPLNFFNPFVTLYGFFLAIWQLYKIYPDVVFSKGGYTSVPVILAAAVLHIPIVIHESDSKPGRANRLAARFAQYIGIAFESCAKYFSKHKTALVGVPMRQAFLAPVPDALTRLGLPRDLPIIFVTGGSLGAVVINNLILDSLDELLPRVRIIHQTGKAHEQLVQQTAQKLITNQSLLERYFVRGTFDADTMNQVQTVASVIVSRAGAGTIFEIAHKGKPAILIPIRQEVSHDQRSNAYEYARTGAAVVLEEENLTDGLLSTEILRIIDDAMAYHAMSTAAQQFDTGQAADKMARVLITIANEHR